MDLHRPKYRIYSILLNLVYISCRCEKLFRNIFAVFGDPTARCHRRSAALDGRVTVLTLELGLVDHSSSCRRNLLHMDRRCVWQLARSRHRPWGATGPLWEGMHYLPRRRSRTISAAIPQVGVRCPKGPAQPAGDAVARSRGP